VADERAVGLARELEQRDEALAAAIAELAELESEVAAVRARAGGLEDFLERLPDERRQAAAAVAEARGELERRRAELRRAEEALAEAEARRRPDADAVAEARRAVVRTRDAVASGDRKLARAEEEAEQLEARAAEAERAVPELETESGRLAERLRALPRVSRAGAEEPRPGLEGVLGWAERALSTLFVARSGLETERERVVREANELGASALGEPLSATSVALVRKRLEER
jgi:chromosome segregation protein